MGNKMAPAVEPNDEQVSAEVVAVARRRKFTASYKRRIVREADACNSAGAVGALLRREGLYSSHLSNWRQEVEASELAALQSKPRGPKPDANKANDRRVLSLEQEVAKLKKQLGPPCVKLS